MNRDYLLRAFDQERAEKRRRHARRQRFPGWLSYAPTRPVGRRREAPDSAWMDVVAVGLGMVALLGCAWLAGAVPQ